MVLQVVISVTHSFRGLPELEKNRVIAGSCLFWHDPMVHLSELKAQAFPGVRATFWACTWHCTASNWSLELEAAWTIWKVVTDKWSIPVGVQASGKPMQRASRASRAFGLCTWGSPTIPHYPPLSPTCGFLVAFRVGISFQVETPVQLPACLNLGNTSILVWPNLVHLLKLWIVFALLNCH